ncbi:MAG: hypothetical protein E6I76_07250 [Chloroflexi bacterium]|nr:MAG: hypothetical protein E6I76_07250 [Chloroflexota bacterium]
MAATTKPPRRLAFGVVGLVLFVLAAGWVVQKKWLSHATPPPGVTLTDLRSVDQLRTIFDADAGSTRLILVLSPT